MTKKFKLVIPENMIDLNGLFDKSIRIFNKSIVRVKCTISKDYCEVVPEIGDYPVFKVNNNWLNPISDPDEFEEWWEKQGRTDSVFSFPGGIQNNFSLKEFARSVHNWSVANEKGKHEPRQTFQEFFSNFITNIPEEMVREIWEKSERNRGY